MQKKVFFLLICAALSVSSFGKTLKIKKKDLKKLHSMMAGEFDSEAQSKADTSYNHILLRLKPIWKDEINGYWYYVEQAAAKDEDRPYRQRVYHLYKQNDTTIVSKVYEIKNPENYIGAWKDEVRANMLTLDSLTDKEGCETYLHKRKSNVYSGSTEWGKCLTTYKGASYTSSETVIYKKKMVTWDRGWNNKDKQVWGAVKGGYSYIKKKKLK